jgi:hypothetical protein
MLLREMTFYDSGRQAGRFLQTRERNIRLAVRIVADAIKNRTLSPKEEADFIGWVLFCIFQVELRRWVMAREPLSAGLKQLERALRLFMNGLQPTRAAFARKTGRRIKRAK